MVDRRCFLLRLVLLTRRAKIVLNDHLRLLFKLVRPICRVLTLGFSLLGWLGLVNFFGWRIKIRIVMRPSIESLVKLFLLLHRITLPFFLAFQLAMVAEPLVVSALILLSSLFRVIA